MSQGEGLQFEKAEFENAPAQAQCAQCHRDLIGSYYEAEGQTICEACKYTLESRMTEGSGAGRFVRATGAGLVAAALGATLYYAITAISGYEFGLIAIVVGFGVGSAVRWGSNGRGGKHYQALAMALTYLAIVATYIPPIIQGFREVAAETAAVEPTVAEDGVPSAVPAAAAAPTETADTVEGEPTGAVPTVIAFAVIVAIACAAPFLAGFENIIGIVIIGIGLYEAWKLNRRTTVTITGPHAISHTSVGTTGA
jgi:hypothetical protein